MGTELAPRQKAAALVLALGSRRAGGVLERLSRAEIDTLAAEISRLGRSDREQRDAILREVLSQIVSIDPAREVQHLRELAHQMEERERNSLFDVDPDAAPFEFIQKVDFEHAVQFLRREHPQTVAVILYFQPPPLAARILAALDDEVAGEIALRIATLGRVPPEMIGRIESAIRKRLTESSANEMSGPEGERDLASILNNADPDIEHSILDAIAGIDRELAERIRALMFVFEDIVTLEDRMIQQILQAVDTKTLGVAMKGSDSELHDVVFRNLSERARESLTEEIDLLGAVRKQDVIEARATVVARIRDMEAAGTIVINRGSEDEYIE